VIASVEDQTEKEEERRLEIVQEKVFAEERKILGLVRASFYSLQTI
jgi:hypothetical protein